MSQETKREEITFDDLMKRENCTEEEIEYCIIYLIAMRMRSLQELWFLMARKAKII